MHDLKGKIERREVKAAVVGLGYVGLPLAVRIAQAGFETTGFDVSTEKVGLLNSGKNYIRDVDSDLLAALVTGKKLKASTDFSSLSEADFISICVPTPLSKGKDPDMSFIVGAITEVKKRLRSGHVVILESTTYPGTTEEVVRPLLEKSGLKAGVDFHLAFSPERIDPGNQQYRLANTPKIIGGLTPVCTEVVQRYYATFIEKVIPVSGPKTAEMVKLLENTFRAINIGLANEIAIMCNHFGIDTWEVIEAAATKPFGFMPFFPGPGLGGHCIPVDPHYLVWKLKSMNYNTRFIQLADEINSSMPHLVVEKIAAALNDRKKPVKDSKVLVLGVAYKKDIDDYRESPSLEVITLLRQRGASVSYNDPHVPRLKSNELDLFSHPLTEEIGQFDCVALLTNHSAYEIKKIVAESQLVVDTRNATKGIRSEKIFKI